jgi:hypothetical protein
MKGQPFLGGVETDNVFQFLKVFLKIAFFFIHANPSKHFVLQTNVLDFAIGMSHMPMP